MATITDGTTTLDIGMADERLDPILEKSSKITAGGNIRSITSGERLRIAIDCRLTPAKYRTLLNIIKSGATNYYFTPNNSTTEYTDLYPNTTWPLNCNIDSIKRKWDNRSYYYVSFIVEAVSYA